MSTPPENLYCKITSFADSAHSTNRLIIQHKYKDENDCPICIDTMLNKTVIYTPCKHIFHISCLFNVFDYGGINTYKCPLCRNEFITALSQLVLVE
jgi:hypothetical protein